MFLIHQKKRKILPFIDAMLSHRTFAWVEELNINLWKFRDMNPVLMRSLEDEMDLSRWEPIAESLGLTNAQIEVCWSLLQKLLGAFHGIYGAICFLLHYYSISFCIHETLSIMRPCLPQWPYLIYVHHCIPQSLCPS